MHRGKSQAKGSGTLRAPVPPVRCAPAAAAPARQCRVCAAAPERFALLSSAICWPYAELQRARGRRAGPRRALSAIGSAGVTGKHYGPSCVPNSLPSYSSSPADSSSGSVVISDLVFLCLSKQSFIMCEALPFCNRASSAP